MQTIKYPSGTRYAKTCKRNSSAVLRAAVEALEGRTLLSSVVVNTASDTATGAGVVTLRDAISMANSSTTPTTITFASSVFKTTQTIALDGTILDASGTEPVTITGPAAGVTVNGSQLSGDLQVDKGASVSLSGMTFTGGKSTSYYVAGGITDLGTVTLTNSVISGNAGNNGGGMIVRHGAATLTDCTVSGNTGTYGLGGGINSYEATVTLTDCTVSGNAGEAILSDSYAGVTPSLTLTDCSVSDNTGGGIFNNGTATFTGCTISGNSGTADGGGIFNPGDATLTNCTISGNSASTDGGGIENFGTAALNNCTVSGNTAGADGGGITNGGTAASFTVANSIIAGNSAKADPDAVGAFNSPGFNLVGATDGSSGWDFDDFTGTAAHPLAAKLGPLANNGGPTQTLLPLAGSPAIDEGDNALIPKGTTTDQRGLPRISNEAVDIGAVEVQVAVTTPITLTAPAAQTAQAGQSKVVALGSFTDSKATGPFSVHVHWGDGTADSTFSVAGAGRIPATAHTFPYSANDTVVVSVTDSAGHTSNKVTFAVSVAGQSRVVVNSASDTAGGLGVVTLDDAIAIANRSAGPTTITFDPKVFAKPQTIALNGSALELGNTSEPTAVIGPAAGVIINGGGISGDFQIDPGVNVSLSGMTVTGGKAGAGGGIQNNGTVKITDCTVSGNSVGVGIGGGGIYNAGTATLTNCTVSGNSAANLGAGGIANQGGTMTLTDCTLSGNTATNGGGAISNNTGYSGSSATATATLTDCTISGNTANVGGGVYNHYATTTLTDCAISGNSAVGSSFSHGGGISNFGGALTLTDSTVANNSSPTGKGGAIYNEVGVNTPQDGLTVVADCTLSGNSATAGGGVYNYNTSPATAFTVANTIVAGDTAPAGPDADGPFSSLGFNLIGKTDGSTGWVKTDLTGNAAKPLNADLGPLANNGGPTLTMLPLPGSPAIGHGSVALIPKGITADQRGFARIVGGKTDIGAVELQKTSVVTGTVFYDANGDGIQDNGEAGLAGVQVYADIGDLGYFVAGDPTTLTGATGGYTLSGVPAGKDVIRQVRPLGYAQTTPANGAGHLVTASAGQTVSGQNFGDRSAAAAPATITGTVFNDANGDGIRDDGEAGLSGVQVYLDLGNVGYFVTGDPTTLTNANGTYTLSGLAAGNYIVRQGLPLGYIQTTPSRGLGDHVTVSAGQTLSGQNFGDMA